LNQHFEGTKNSTPLSKSDSSKKSKNSSDHNQISNRLSIEKEIQFIEKEITSTEEEIKKIDESMNHIDFESEEGKQLLSRYQEIQEKLKDLMKTWEEKNILHEASSQT
jgi:Xaa-Pro aminopeptidase